MALFLVAAPRWLAGVLEVPLAVWAGCGFFAFFWAMVPILNVYTRSRGGQGIPLGRVLLSSIVGGAVGGALFALLI